MPAADARSCNLIRDRHCPSCFHHRVAAPLRVDTHFFSLRLELDAAHWGTCRPRRGDGLEGSAAGQGEKGSHTDNGSPSHELHHALCKRLHYRSAALTDGSH